MMYRITQEIKSTRQVKKRVRCGGSPRCSTSRTCYWLSPPRLITGALSLGLVATLLAGVTPAVYAQPTQTLFAQSQVELSQQGEAKLESGDYKGAIEAYNQALQVNASNPSAYINRGMARFELGDKKGAINDFTKALQLNPNDASVYRKRAGVYLTLGKKKKAREDLQQAARLSGGGGEANSQQTPDPQRQPQQ